jgi:flagellar motor switch/type III secretory pathway protein FliN
MHREEAPTGAVTVTPVVLPEFEYSAPERTPRPLATIGAVHMTVAVVAGRARLRMGQIRDLAIGSIIALDRAPEDGVEVLINGVLAAQADTIVVEDLLAARLTGRIG